MVMKLKTQIFPLSHFISNDYSHTFWISSIIWFVIETKTETKNVMSTSTLSILFSLVLFKIWIILNHVTTVNFNEANIIVPILAAFISTLWAIAFWTWEMASDTVIAETITSITSCRSDSADVIVCCFRHSVLWFIGLLVDRCVLNQFFHLVTFTVHCDFICWIKEIMIELYQN